MKTGFFRRKRAVIDIVETPLITEPKIETTINQGIVSGGGPLSENEDQTVPFSGSGLGSPTDQTVLHATTTEPPKTKQKEKHRKPQKTANKVKQRNVLRENEEELNHIFVNALFALAVVEIFACPILILIDAVVLSKQNEENFSYGQQRVFGSLGYLMFFFIVNALLQNSLRPVCGEIYADFVICFCFFALITIVTLIGTVKLPSMNCVSSCSGTRPFFRLRQIFYTKHFGTLFANICFMGFAHSFLENYFNSIVMDSKVSYSTSVTINFFRSIGEPLALFFSSMVLNRAGIINVLFGIPLVTALNLFASSFITSPWHAIPLGLLDGCTYGISWVAYATYLIGSAPDDCTATVQGCFQSAYWGIGNGLRVLIGTSIMTLVGPSTSLRLFTIVGFCITIAFIVGLRHLHFTEKNFYTTLIRRLEGLCEEQIKCEVIPPIKQGGDSNNEAMAHKVTVMEKSERKKDGGKKDNIKKGKHIEDNKF
ncbi:Major facilitator superfamily domain-containing protein 6 [Exaiptasia diaphana]|nr:Major facilitator superfamily domain-containing protein 6 [Exaiptasia diaphana]